MAKKQNALDSTIFHCGVFQDCSESPIAKQNICVIQHAL